MNLNGGSSSVLNQRNGQLQIIFGPMFSGKTTELMRRIKRFQLANYKCFVIKYAKDIRYDDNNLSTHDRQTLAAVPAVNLMDLLDSALEADVIGIDEAQFFPDTVTFCERLTEIGKTVIVAALDGTFQKKPFGNILSLVPMAESVVKLTAVCMTCFGDASFTKRIGSETELEVIGGADKYMAVCRSCYNRNQKVYESPRKNRSKLSELNCYTENREFGQDVTNTHSNMMQL